MKKRLMSLLLVCSMILSLFTGLSVTALAAGTGPAAATPTPTVASAFEPSNGEITGFDFSVENVVIPAIYQWRNSNKDRPVGVLIYWA